jgi:hypothetical protein
MATALDPTSTAAAIDLVGARHAVPLLGKKISDWATVCGNCSQGGTQAFKYFLHLGSLIPISSYIPKLTVGGHGVPCLYNGTPH